MNWELTDINYETKVGIILGSLSMFLVIVAIITLYIIFSIKNKRKNKEGFIFEQKISRQLSAFAKNSKNYKFKNGAKFQYAGDQFFEIDGLLYTNKFILIVETKYIKGELKGDASDKFINVVNNGTIKKFANPLIQNFKHIDHLYKMCGFKFPVLSLLVLPFGSQFKLKNQGNWSVVVNENNFEEILNELYESLQSSSSIKKSVMSKILTTIKEKKVNSIKALKKIGKNK